MSDEQPTYDACQMPQPDSYTQAPIPMSPPQPTGRVAWSDSTWAFLTLRLWLALRAILTGFEKYAGFKTEQRPKIDPVTGMEDISGAIETVKVKVYALAHYHGVPESLGDKLSKEPLLPPFLYDPYCLTLGPALIVLGIMLLVGLGTRISLFLQGLLYISLTFGLILIKADDGVAWLAIHMLLIAAALVLAKHNKLALCKRF